MKLYAAARLVCQVLLSMAGLLMALALSVVAGPAGCGRSVLRGLAPSDTTVRASVLFRMRNKPAVPVVLPVRDGYQLMQVRRLIDADTYEVQPAAGGGVAWLRLVGVDAPESDQPFGKQATAAVSAVLLGRYAWVHVAGADQYGRNLAVVRLRALAFDVPRTVALDSLLVVRGWAWAYAPAGQLVRWAALQQQAQGAALGLWKCGTAGVVRPGIWRAYNRQYKASAGWGCPW